VTDLKNDLLEEAEAIAEFMFGDPKRKRAVYHLASKRELPVFRIGNRLFARRSALLGWIESQERAATKQTEVP
jgi:hypothetical protein